MFLNAESGPAFLLFLLWLALASGVLLRRTVQRKAPTTATTTVAAHYTRRVKDSLDWVLGKSFVGGLAVEPAEYGSAP